MQRHTWIRVGVALSAAAVLTGCATPPAVERVAIHVEPVAAWYSIGPAGASAARIDHDVAAVGTMHIPTLLVRRANAADLPALLNAAARYDLQLVIPDARAARYVRSGLGGRAPLADSAEIPRSPRIVGRYLGHIVDAGTAYRAQRVAARSRQQDPALATCVTVDGAYAPGSGTDLSAAFDLVIGERPSRLVGGESTAPPGRPAGGLATVYCGGPRGAEPGNVRAWLADYHLAVLAGQTGGVVFDGLASAPQAAAGAAAAASASGATPERSAMIKRIVLRARQWSRLLAGFAPAQVTLGDTGGAALRAACLSAGRRRFLLVVNPSTTLFVRREVGLPAAIGGAGVRRAVTVAAADDAPVGQVYDATGAGLRVAVELAPGDAQLFELF